MAYDNEGRGVLFVNDRKANDRQPDYKGKIQLDGIEYELAGWLRTSRAGNQFISVSLGDKVDRGNPKQYGGVNGSAAVTPPQSDVAIDDIPF